MLSKHSLIVTGYLGNPGINEMFENGHEKFGMSVDVFYTLYVVSASLAAFASKALSGIMPIKALRNLETR